MVGGDDVRVVDVGVRGRGLRVGEGRGGVTEECR